MCTSKKYFGCLFGLLLSLQILTTKGQGLLISSGSRLVVNGSAKIAIQNAGFTNNGIFTAGNGSVIFTGDAATTKAYIGGSSVTGFYDLTLNKSVNGIILSSNINVDNNINFISGDSLFLNDHIINLGTTGMLVGERNSSRITGLTGGYIQRTEFLSAGVPADPGNLGIEITCTVFPGNTVIRRGHMRTADMPAAAIYRYYDVKPVNNAALNATVKFNYLDGETGTSPENNLMMYSNAAGDNNWTFLGMTTADMVQDFVTKQNVEQLNKFILADLGSILPIQLIYFNAKAVNGHSLLNWRVAEEDDIDHYEIERSVDGLHFIGLQSVNKTGNSGGTQNYESSDLHPVTGFNYYRLKLVDKQHHYTYSRIVLVNFSGSNEISVGIYPNPAHDLLKISFGSGKTEQLQLAMFDAKGRLLETKTVMVISGNNEIPWDIRALPAGNYFIRLQEGSSLKTIQFVKQ